MERPVKTVGDDGIYLVENQKTNNFSLYSSVSQLEKAGASLEQILTMMSLTVEKFDALKKEFEITDDDDL